MKGERRDEKRREKDRIGKDKRISTRLARHNKSPPPIHPSSFGHYAIQGNNSPLTGGGSSFTLSRQNSFSGLTSSLLVARCCRCLRTWDNGRWTSKRTATRMRTFIVVSLDLNAHSSYQQIVPYELDNLKPVVFVVYEISETACLLLARGPSLTTYFIVHTVD